MPDNIHFSTGFVAESRPQIPTVCVDAVSIIEWRSNALSIIEWKLDAVSIVEWRSNAQWKRASDKCKPTP